MAPSRVEALTAPSAAEGRNIGSGSGPGLLEAGSRGGRQPPAVGIARKATKAAT